MDNIEDSPFFLIKSDDKWRTHGQEMKRKLLNRSYEDPNITGEVFFSYENKDIINKQLIMQVYNKSNKKYLVGKQKDNDLTFVMKWVWSEYERYMPKTNVTDQIRYLNKKVVDEIYLGVIRNAEQKVNYLKDISSPITVNPLPVNVSIKGAQSLPSMASQLTTR